MITPETTKPDNAPETRKTPPGQCSGASHCSQILAWPDRAGIWWLRDRWGMSIAESFEHRDEEENESPWAVQCHVGDSETQGPFMPRDLDNSEFVWLGESFPSANVASDLSPSANGEQKNNPDVAADGD